MRIRPLRSGPVPTAIDLTDRLGAWRRIDRLPGGAARGVACNHELRVRLLRLSSRGLRARMTAPTLVPTAR